jgi:hypothetical protein
MRRFYLLILLVTLLWGTTGCRDGKIAVYRIPKETDAPASGGASLPGSAAAPASNGAAGFAVAQINAGELEWTAPAQWKSKPASSMRKASYAVGGEREGNGDLAITAFPGDVGGDLANVNRWRGQLQLPPISEDELGGAITAIETNGLKMRVVDLAGGPADKPQRMLGAIVPYAGATWFFKLIGPGNLVSNEKQAYDEFLHTIRPAPAAGQPIAVAVSDSPVPDLSNTPVPADVGPSDLKWTAPSDWQSKPASAMRKATYLISGQQGGIAELSVTSFPGAVGGELANVNRWRGQLQLAPIAEADLAVNVSRFSVNGLTVAVVDLAGGTAEKPQRMLGAIVPVKDANWFFKLTGPEDVVAQQKPAFLAFLQTLQAP